MNNPNQKNQNQDDAGGQQDQRWSAAAAGRAEQARSARCPAVGWAKQARSARRSATLVSKTRGPAFAGPSLCVEVHFSRLGGFRFPIDNAFRDLS